jgi:hypothetical protein
MLIRIIAVFSLSCVVSYRVNAVEPDPACVAIGRAQAKELYPGLQHEGPSNETPNFPSPESPDYLIRCKSMPADASKMILVLPRRQTDAGKEANECCVADILILNGGDRKVLSRREIQLLPVQTGVDVGGSDWYRVTDLSIDTAAYRLTPGVRAFGIRAVYEPASPHRYFDRIETLNFFVIDGTSVRRVLGSLVTSRYSGMPSSEEEKCSPVEHQLLRVISIAPANSHGYADLSVRETFDKTGGMTDGGACSEVQTHEKRRFELHYDGNEYGISKELHILNEVKTPR